MQIRQGRKASEEWKHAVVSSRRQVTRILLIFVIPFIIFLVSYNVYSVKALNEGLAETGQNIINIYKNPIETQIYSLQQSIVDIMANDSDFQQLLYARKQYETYVALENVGGKFQRMLGTDTAVTGCILYDEGYGLMKEIYTGSCSYNYEDKEGFKEVLHNYLQQDELREEGWKIWEVNGNYFLFRIYQKGDIFIMGIYDLERTQKPQNFEESDPNAFLFFTDSQDNAITSVDRVNGCGLELREKENGKYYFSGTPVRFLIVQDEMGELPFKVVYAAPYYGFFEAADLFPLLFLFVSMVLVVLLWVTFRMLLKKYLKPFQSLVETMETIRDGDMEAKMEEGEKILEFHILSKTFNEMMAEIKALKISSYEYQIEMQQAKLQYLQIQIRPHFFLNCLKNLYGLAEEGKTQQIQKTILVLSDYLRYMMRDNFHKIPLETELQNVDNYIRLQQLTSSRSILCHTDVEKGLQGYEIPPLSILAFVENAIKHGSQEGKPMKIQIRINSWEGDGEDYVSIMILDNGAGFSEESLKELNGKETYEYSARHVGIENVKRRFSLIYQDKVSVLFSNMTGSGACVQMIIPADVQSEKNMGDQE